MYLKKYIGTNNFIEILNFRHIDIAPHYYVQGNFL